MPIIGAKDKGAQEIPAPGQVVRNRLKETKPVPGLLGQFFIHRHGNRKITRVHGGEKCDRHTAGQILIADGLPRR